MLRHNRQLIALLLPVLLPARKLETLNSFEVLVLLSWRPHGDLSPGSRSPILQTNRLRGFALRAGSSCFCKHSSCRQPHGLRPKWVLRGRNHYAGRVSPHDSRDETRTAIFAYFECARTGPGSIGDHNEML